MYPFGVFFSLGINISIFSTMIVFWKLNLYFNAVSFVIQFIPLVTLFADLFAASNEFSVPFALGINITVNSAVVIFWSFNNNFNTFTVLQLISFITLLTNFLATSNEFSVPFSLGINIAILGAVIISRWRSGHNQVTSALVIQLVSWLAFNTNKFASIEPFGVFLAFNVKIFVFGAVVIGWGWCCDDSNAKVAWIKLVTWVTLDADSVVIVVLTVGVALTCDWGCWCYWSIAFAVNRLAIAWVTWAAVSGLFVPGLAIVAHLSAKFRLLVVIVSEWTFATCASLVVFVTVRVQSWTFNLLFA